MKIDQKALIRQAQEARKAQGPIIIFTQEINSAMPVNSGAIFFKYSADKIGGFAVAGMKPVRPDIKNKIIISKASG